MPDLKATRAALGDGMKEFRLFVFGFAAFYLALVWGLEFPPLQDYPMRLFIGYAAATFESPAYNWGEFFELQNNYGSYSLTFWFLRAATPFVGIEAAGLLFLSVYVCAVAAVALVETRGRENTPWPLLLLFPLAFNQTYIIGLMGYFMSAPFLLLALRHLQTVVTKPLTPRRLAAHAALQSVIFFCHPLTCVLYVGFGMLTAFFRRGRALARAVFLAGGFGAVFALWYLNSSAGGGFEFSPRWWPFTATLEFFLLMFSGMKITDGPDWIASALWFATFAFLAYSGYRMRGKTKIPNLDLLMFALCAAGFLALPFSPGSPYTYFNIRLVVFVYFFGAIVLSNLGMCRFAGRVFASAVVAISIWQGFLHYGLSNEIAGARPVIERMEKNSVILPVVEDGRSALLDPVYFYQFHDHVPEYYHVLAGGGANPVLISNPAFPIRYRLPSPMLEVLRSPRIGDYACCYRYLITRGGRFGGLDRFGPFVRIDGNRNWTLFEIKTKGKTEP